MADRNMEQRRANYKSKSQFNAADVGLLVLFFFWVQLDFRFHVVDLYATILIGGGGGGTGRGNPDHRRGILILTFTLPYLSAKEKEGRTTSRDQKAEGKFPIPTREGFHSRRQSLLALTRSIKITCVYPFFPLKYTLYVLISHDPLVQFSFDTSAIPEITSAYHFHFVPFYNQREESIAKRRHFVSDDSGAESEDDDITGDAKVSSSSSTFQA